MEPLHYVPTNLIPRDMKKRRPGTLTRDFIHLPEENCHTHVRS
jgi:hypothetical protein